MSKWYQGGGAHADVVLFSKVSLSRNLAESPFPAKMNEDIRKSVMKKIYAVVKSSPYANEFDMLSLADLSPAEAQAYTEKQLISETMIKSEKKGAFMLSKNEDISIMLCDEDHMKISAFSAGQSLEEAYQKANMLDDVFIGSLKLAFSEKLGFLTASPMHLGTGMKASCALHLPALSERRSLYRLSSMVAKLGLNLREMFAQGAGDIYILSNQVSLGISEKSALDNLEAICNQIVAQEQKAREELKENIDFEDKIYRTLGILQSARKLTQEEFLNYISYARLGTALKYLDLDYKTIGDMLYGYQDASLQADAKTELNKEMCAKLRAQIIRERLE